METLVIVSAARTPMGSFQGALTPLTAPQLGGIAIKEALKRANLAPDTVDETLMGCVLPAGLGQAPARQAAMAAGLPNSVGAVTINKMCGSGMKAIMQGCDSILAGTNNIVVAGGIESMTNAPYLLAKARGGYRLGHDKIIDHMFLDGLEDAYDKGKLMGCFAESTAEEYGFTREAQDEFAIRSLTRAQEATEKGLFKEEIVPVEISTKKETFTISEDQGPKSANISKIPSLKPAFKSDGTVTAANSSSISDGAAALIIMTKSEAEKRGLTPLATIKGYSTHSQEPSRFTTAPVGAMKKLMEKLQWSVSDVDLFEINEAFAVVTMAAIKDLNLPAEKVNIHGGACALGHPIGASGARIVVTLLSALKHYHLKRGIASLCIGGGEATALAVELIG